MILSAFAVQCSSMIDEFPFDPRRPTLELLHIFYHFKLRLFSIYQYYDESLSNHFASISLE